MEPLRKQRNPDLIMDPNILLSASISYDEMGKYERYTRMITSLIPLTKSLAQQKPDRHTKSLGTNSLRASKDKFEKHMDDMLDVGCLVLATITLELQKQQEYVVSYEMIQNLKEIFEGKARQ
ncbi:hypothetical protein V6N13_118347 [Hibiscus sabdariffa]